jgi:hypothetical protein
MSGAVSKSVHAIGRIEFDAAELMSLHPPRFANGHKRTLVSRVTAPVEGKVRVSRWRGDLPAVVEAPLPDFEMHEDIFSYPPTQAGTTAWHLNFADAELFGYYNGPLLAQDEHQVLEHPVLGSIRHALLERQRSNANLAPRTRDSGVPSPYLVMGAQRCISFDTIAGPYGNAFAAAPIERILRAATFLNPATSSNILAMEAPPGGRGAYSGEQITDILHTAYVGFSACKLESAPNKAVVHTGNWGCGAYGGNPVLMAFLQLCAARLAGVDRLVFHTFSPKFSDSYMQAVKLLDELTSGQTINVRTVIEELHSRGFEWGQSDGN